MNPDLQPKSKLPDEVRTVMQLRHPRIRTEEAYVQKNGDLSALMRQCICGPVLPATPMETIEEPRECNLNAALTVSTVEARKKKPEFKNRLCCINIGPLPRRAF